MKTDSDYTIADGTYYDKRTDLKVIQALENARRHNIRVVIRLGDVETGRDWLDEWGMEGTISRSMGPHKIPLLIANRRSMGGARILEHCILRIASSDGKTVFYQHPKYQCPSFSVGAAKSEGYLEGGYCNGELHAQFKKEGQAARWVKKMTRYCGTQSALA
jgi:hypothetical protein